MKRVERIELTRRLLDNGRLSDRDISKLVARSQRWVRDIARQYPRNREIQVVYPPKPVRNKARCIDESPRESAYPNQFWYWTDRIGSMIIIALCVIGSMHRASSNVEASNEARKAACSIAHSFNLNL